MLCAKVNEAFDANGKPFNGYALTVFPPSELQLMVIPLNWVVPAFLKQ